MSALVRRREDGRMEPRDDLSRRASELLEDARRFQSATAKPGCHIDAPDALVSLEEALQVLSAAWYQLAADASPGLAREQEVHLMGTLHDVGAALARCARACREGRLAVTPIIGRHVAAGRAHDRRPGNELPRVPRHERPGQRVA
jgi:hypothetical protein